MTIQTLKNECLQRLPFVYIYKLSYPFGSGLRMALPILPEPIFQGLVPAWPKDNLRGRETLTYPGPLSLNHGPQLSQPPRPLAPGERSGRPLNVSNIMGVATPGPLSSPRGTSRKWNSTFSCPLHGQPAPLHHCQSPTQHPLAPATPFALLPCHASPPPPPWPRPPPGAQDAPHPRP